MADNIFAKFNEMFNADELSASINEAANQGDFVKKDVPFDNYEVKIVKLDIGEHEFDGDYKGMPEAHVWFRIINHPEYGGQTLFMNKKLISLKNPSNGFLLHKFNEFLETLESGITPVFENWTQYSDLVTQIFNAIDGRAEYQLDYKEVTSNGFTFKDYVIVKKF